MAFCKPKIVGGNGYVIGLDSDGTCRLVESAGDFAETNASYSHRTGANSWTGIVDVATAGAVVVGLKKDGSCVALGLNLSNNEVAKITAWNNVRLIAGNCYGIVALKTDGTIVISGSDDWKATNTSGWNDVIKLGLPTPDDMRTVVLGLKKDGTVISSNSTSPVLTNVVDMATSDNQAIFLKKDGTCESKLYNYSIGDTGFATSVSGWKDIVAINTFRNWQNRIAGTIGLKKDGTIVYTTTDHYKDFDFSSMKDLKYASVAYIALMGIKKDGTAIYIGYNSEDKFYKINNWKFKLDYTGMLFSRKAIDFSKADYVDGFNLDGILPTDCKKKLAFRIDDTYYKLTQTSGTSALSALTVLGGTDGNTAVNAAAKDITPDYVLANGNTVEEISACTNNNVLVGKQIYPIVALYAPDNATAFPTIQMSANARNNQDTYTKTEYSAEYSLTAGNAKAVPRIISITADTALTGKATATVTVSIKASDGTWSDYMDLLAAKDKQSVAVKYRAVHTVTTLDGTDTSKVTAVTALYTTGSASVSGDTAEIYTVTQNYEAGLGYCQSLIKHKALIDAEIRAFVAFRNEPKTRTMIPLGTGTGAAQTLTLGVAGTDGKIVADPGINQNKLSIYFDGKPAYSYSYNTETSQATFTADAGVAISASYEYGWEAETWREMTKTTTQPYDAAGTYATYFEYTLPTGEEKKTISNIKYVLYRPSGHITDAALGTATGSRQVFVLPHKAKAETIVCSGSWSYDDNAQILTVVAVQGTALTISYDYIAESQEVYGVTAGWAED